MREWDLSKMRDLSTIFLGETSFNGDISKWDVSHVTDMNRMFTYTKSFNSNISAYDTSSCKVVFLLFTYVFFGPCDCGFSVFRLRLLWTTRLWFFCSSFMSSLGRAIVVFLLFVCVFCGSYNFGITCSSSPSVFTTITSRNSTLFHI